MENRMDIPQKIKTRTTMRCRHYLSLWALLRYNWQRQSYIFKVYNVIWYMYTLCSDHHHQVNQRVQHPSPRIHWHHLDLCYVTIFRSISVNVNPVKNNNNFWIMLRNNSDLASPPNGSQRPPGLYIQMTLWGPLFCRKTYLGTKHALKSYAKMNMGNRALCRWRNRRIFSR